MSVSLFLVAVLDALMGRGVEYCRILKQHSTEKASVCSECELKRNSITVCRQTLHHTESNVFKQTSKVPRFLTVARNSPGFKLNLMQLESSKTTTETTMQQDA